MVRPLQFLINLSLGTSIFPMKWKLVWVLPLLKSCDADKMAPKLYCPVSHLSIVSKLAEQKVQVQLLKHLETTGQLHSDHHTYRGHHSTMMALIKMTDSIASAVDQNLIANSMSIDQSAAFNCVEHEILLSKLSYYSLDERTTDWI